MRNEKSLQKKEESVLSFSAVWTNPDKIKKLFAPDLSDMEFSYFMGLSKMAKANPFLHEIWAVKYDKTKAASVFLGRDHYRGIAQGQPDYDGHMSDAIYSNDKFSVKNGIPEHEYNLEERGDLIGAYALVWVKGRQRPNFKRVKFSEYNKKQSTWVQIPETMICKVAEAQALRMTWQSAYSGAYSEDENIFAEENFKPETPDKAQPKKTNGAGLDYQGLETMMLDKLCTIDKVKEYLKAKGLGAISEANAMQFRIIWDDVEGMK